VTAGVVDVRDPGFAQRLLACADTPAGAAMSADAESLVDALLAALERGEVRAAVRGDDGVWRAVPWVKRGILLGFRVGKLVDMSVGVAPGATVPFFDKHTIPRQSFVADEFRGRLMSVYSLISVGLSQVFGAFAAGAVASAVGVDWAIGAGAAVMLGFAMYAFRRESSWIVTEH
jgi:hypothetical protein